MWSSRPSAARAEFGVCAGGCAAWWWSNKGPRAACFSVPRGADWRTFVNVLRTFIIFYCVRGQRDGGLMRDYTPRAHHNKRAGECVREGSESCPRARVADHVGEGGVRAAVEVIQLFNLIWICRGLHWGCEFTVGRGAGSCFDGPGVMCMGWLGLCVRTVVPKAMELDGVGKKIGEKIDEMLKTVGARARACVRACATRW